MASRTGGGAGPTDDEITTEERRSDDAPSDDLSLKPSTMRGPEAMYGYLVALELVAMGHDDLAVAWCRRRHPYSRRAGRWAARRLLARPDLAHGVRILLRHVRLIAAAPSRGAAHARGAWVRELAIVLRELLRANPPAAVRDELARMLDHLTDAAAAEAHAAMEHAAHALFRDLYRAKAPATRDPILSATLRS